MNQRLSIVTLGVGDLARACDFYTSVGFARRHDLGDIVFLPTTGPVLALFDWSDLAADAGLHPESHGFRGVSLAMNLDNAAAVDEQYRYWMSAGATSHRSPELKEWGGYSCYVADLDGHLWEFAYNPSTALMRIDDDGRLHLT